MIDPSEHEAAWSLLAGSFHEEWIEEAPSWQAVVDRFAAEADLRARTDAIRDLEALLARTDDWPESLFLAWGIRVVPDPLSERQWVTAVRDRLAGAEP